MPSSTETTKAQTTKPPEQPNSTPTPEPRSGRTRRLRRSGHLRRSGLRRALPWILLALSPFILLGELWVVLVADAIYDYRGSHVSVDLRALRTDRFARWQDPPVVEGDWEFRWGVSQQWSEIGPHKPAPFAEWEHLYASLDPDIVRVFVSWREVQPTPQSWNTDYLANRLSAFHDAGYDIQAAVHRGPKWAATGGWMRHVGTSLWSRMPPKRFDSEDGPYARFLQELHGRYPNIDIWQIWNEPDWPHGLETPKLNPLAGRYWRGSAHDYGALVASSVPVVEGFDDGSEISTGGIAVPSYLETVLEVPGAREADIYDLHFVSGNDHPDVDLALDRMIALVEMHIDRLGAVGVAAPQMSISELSYPWSEDGERDQADFVTKSYSVANALGWGVLSWFAIGPSEPSYYTDSGLVDFDRSARPAFEALRYNKVALDGLRPDGLLGDGNDVRIAAFRTPAGRPVWVAWSLAGDGVITWPDDAGPAAMYDGLGNRVRKVAAGETVRVQPLAQYIVPADAGE